MRPGSADGMRERSYTQSYTHGAKNKSMQEEEGGGGGREGKVCGIETGEGKGSVVWQGKGEGRSMMVFRPPVTGCY